MKIPGFGSNKDDSPHREKKVDHVETVYVSDTEEKDIEEEHNNMEYNDDDDYIDPDDICYDEYEDIANGIENSGWTEISSAGVHPITQFDTNIVIISPVRKDARGNVLEIVCPKDIIIAICGFHQIDVDNDDFYKTPNLYTRPHFVTLKCMDDTNKEISPNTIVSILLTDKDGGTERLYQEFYSDLSPTANGDTTGKLKEKQERYYIAETIVLQRGEKLTFHVYNPDRDISRVELLMMSDMFGKDE